MVKVTFTFDEATIQQLKTASARTKKPKSQVVREAIHEYSERTEKLSDAERARLLNTLDRYIKSAPRRPPAEIDGEITRMRTARRTGGRRHPVD